MAQAVSGVNLEVRQLWEHEIFVTRLGDKQRRHQTQPSGVPVWSFFPAATGSSWIQLILIGAYQWLFPA